MNPPTFSLHKLQLFAIILCTTVSVSLLTLSLPRQEVIGYDYEEGRPWRYGSLIAPYDFPINKTQTEIQNEIDSAMRQFSPLFKLDDTVAPSQLAAFKSDVANNRFADVDTRTIAHATQLLEKVYERGIIDVNSLKRYSDHGSTHVVIVNRQQATTLPVANFFTTPGAYQFIMKADTLHFSREKLSRLALNNYLLPNLLLDSLKTNAAIHDMLQSLSMASGMIQTGEKIIDRGEIATASKIKILDSFQAENARQAADKDIHRWQLILGQALFNLFVIATLLTYLYVYRRKLLHSQRTIYFIFTLITVFPVLAHLLVMRNLLSIYILPFAMTGLFARIFTDSRTATMTMLTTILLSSLGLREPYEFLLVETIAGLTAIIGVSDLTERSQLLRVALTSTLAMLVFDVIYDLTQGTTLQQLDSVHYSFIAAGGFSLLFAYPLLYLFERIFGYTSSVSLIELTNINNPLLSRLSREAQGTFQHSMQVANLASEVAAALGANIQLVRTGAFYHDIGKLTNPLYFTENQSGVNPHEKLSETESAQIIISHVTEGLRLALEHRLPASLRQFISTHHGRGKAKYFYIQWLNTHPNQQPDESAFTYPGPNPQTIEQAILMMADAVEASSRSLSDYSPQSITQLVNRIVDTQISDGLFHEAPISFVDINIAKHTLIENLKKIYHTRVAYPELHKKESEAIDTNTPDTATIENEESENRQHGGWFKRRWGK